MSEFKTIETQEELDAIIGKRLERERNKIAEQYADYEELKAYKDKGSSQLADIQKALNEANDIIKGHEEEKNALTSKLKAYEVREQKTKIAQEVGLDLSLADRINGEDEESMKADAEILAKAFNKTPPLANPEPQQGTDIDKEYKRMLHELGGN